MAIGLGLSLVITQLISIADSSGILAIAPLLRVLTG